MIDQIRIFREHEYGFEPDYELQSLICRRLHELSDRDLHTVAAAHDNNFRRVVSNAAGLQGTWRKVKVKLQSRAKWICAESYKETSKLPNVLGNVIIMFEVSWHSDYLLLISVGTELGCVAVLQKLPCPKCMFLFRTNPFNISWWGLIMFVRRYKSWFYLLLWEWVS